MGHRGQFGYITPWIFTDGDLDDHRQNLRNMADAVLATCPGTPGADALRALAEDVDATMARWSMIAEAQAAIWEHGDQIPYHNEELLAACERYVPPDLTVQRPFFPKVVLRFLGGPPGPDVPWLLDFIPDRNDQVLVDSRYWWVTKRLLNLETKTLVLHLEAV